MITRDVELLLTQDESVVDMSNISVDVLESIDNLIVKFQHKISGEAYSIYKKFIAMKQSAPDGMKKELFFAFNNYIKEKIVQKEYVDALLLLRFLLVKSQIQANTYYDIAEVLLNLGNSNLALSFIKHYELKETNKPLKYLTLGNFYNLQLKDYKTAIRYYEKYLKIDETKSVVYTIVGSLYAKAYGEFSLKDQIYYFKRAYKLNPNDRLILHSLAFGYEKYGDKIEADKYYKKLLENEPTETDYYNYGAFLISCGDFENGHKYFTHRFNIDDINLKYPIEGDRKKWDLISDISEQVLLVHYEQGFGDTFMYSRFVPFLKNFAKKIIFVVQDDLYELIKHSEIFSEIEVISDKTDIASIDYDKDMALLDVPYVLKTKSNNLPYTGGYLSVPEENVKSYHLKNIKQSDNIKVGLSYHGSKIANYNGRDIDFARFQKLLKTDKIDFYSFVMDTEKSDKIIPLGQSFKNFMDTACALKCMDIVISTDNVILNLAGAMGIKTYGLFNKYPNYRWYKLKGEDVGWYKSVKPLQVEETNCWAPVFSQLHKILNNMLM